MTVHIGEKIRERAKELRIGPTELGKLVNTSKQNVYGIYKRKSIDTELLFGISKALKYNFFDCYSFENTRRVAEKGVPYITSTEHQLNELGSKLDQALAEIEKLKGEINNKEINYLKKINKLLENNK